MPAPLFKNLATTPVKTILSTYPALTLSNRFSSFQENFCIFPNNSIVITDNTVVLFGGSKQEHNDGHRHCSH